jgi:general secretion pathway protein D
MRQALDLLLSPAQLRANIIGQLVTISPLPEIELKPKAGTNFVFKKQVLRYADTRTLEPILSELLITSESDDDDDWEHVDVDDGDWDYDDDGEDRSGGSSGTTQRLSITAIHSQNAILIKGSSADVNNTLDILKSLDTDSGHILIEALVLEFSIDHFLQIGSAISAGSSGQFSDVSIDWANLIGETIAFTKMATTANTRAFRAAISMLIQHDFGRVISRPYLATVSGKEAKIEVVEDRYVTTFQGYGDEVTLEPVTSGISLTMTPFLLPDEQIRLDISISASQFVPSLGNVSLTRSRSEATSTIQIGAGQTLVIGGLMKEEASSSGAGVPGVRDVPGLGFLFGRKQSIVGKRRVLIYITPYIWEPGMETPVDSRLRLEDFMKSQKDF